MVQANCWLFTGAIQQYLHQHVHAMFVFGQFVKSNWALKTRTRVMNALERLYNVSAVPLLVYLQLYQLFEILR